MDIDKKDKFSVGLDVGSSGIRLQLTDTKANNLLLLRKNYNEVNYEIWDDNGYYFASNAFKIIMSLINELKENFQTINIESITISTIGPSIVLINRRGETIEPSFSYKSTDTEKFKVDFPTNFQKETGGFYSSSMPFTFFKKLQKEKFFSYSKFTSINDYFHWKLSGLAVEDIFMTIPNASYTGIYSLEKKHWHTEILMDLSIHNKVLPKLITLGTNYNIDKNLSNEISILSNTQIYPGMIDGFDAFWAAGVYPNSKIVVASAGTTGAIRTWRETRRINFPSKTILCCYVQENSFIDLIPFNNVGTSLTWFANLLRENNLTDYLETNGKLKLTSLEKECLEMIERAENIPDIPIYFPFAPEGEIRGPNARGRKIPGGFLNKRGMNRSNVIEFYLSLIIGIANLFRHNYDTLIKTSDSNEIRITGEVASKSQILCIFLATLLKKKIVTFQNEANIAKAIALRSLLRLKMLEKPIEYQEINITKPYKNLQELVTNSYSKYLKIYNNPLKYFKNKNH